MTQFEIRKLGALILLRRKAETMGEASMGKHLKTSMAKQPKLGKCQICGVEKRLDEMSIGAILRPSVFQEIQGSFPEFDPSGYICLTDLNNFRWQQMRNLLEEEKGELSKLDQEVIQAIRDHEMLQELEDEDEHLTFGERMSDHLASFGGSWTFIILFAVVLIGWMVGNLFWLRERAFDPFPFILLNLVLSCLAAIQAPIILMSQNRTATKDRQREINDYKTNLKAEMEIRMLHEKIDKLMTNQWQRLLEIQQLQMDFMEDSSSSRKS